MNMVFESMFLFALTLLGIDITIYVLSVTLLRDAIKIFRKTRSSFSTHKEIQSKQVWDSDMQKSIHNIDNINSLSFTNAFTFPCLFFLLAIVTSIAGRYAVEVHNKSDWFSFTAAIVTTLAGIVCLVKTLKAIEEVASADTDEAPTAKP